MSQEKIIEVIDQMSQMTAIDMIRHLKGIISAIEKTLVKMSTPNK